MQVTIEHRPGSRVALTITVDAATLDASKEKLFQEHAQRISVPGFRPGKAPRRMLEARLNEGALLQDAIEDVIDTTYRAALLAHQLEPLERGEIEDVQHGEGEQALTYTVVLTVRPAITLPSYTGLEITHEATQVTEDQVEAEINRYLERSADYKELTETPIEEGDYVTVDYTMLVDGAPYPEGEASGYPLEVGSDNFFPELNEALLGTQADESITVEKTYDAEYTNAELAGKTAVFTITITQVRRMVKPEPDDAWAQFVTQGAVSTVEELRARLGENLRRMAADHDREHLRSALLRQVVDGATMEIPDILADEQFDHQMEDLEARLNRERMSLADYAEMSGRSESEIEQEQQLLARDRVRNSLVMQEIARREGIRVADEDIQALIATITPSPKEARKLHAEWQQSGQLDQMASRLFHEKVLQFLEEHATITIEGAEAPDVPAEEAAPPDAE